MSERFNKLVGEMRNVLADRNLLQAKSAFYDKILENGITGAETAHSPTNLPDK